MSNNLPSEVRTEFRRQRQFMMGLRAGQYWQIGQYRFDIPVGYMLPTREDLRSLTRLFNLYAQEFMTAKQIRPLGTARRNNARTYVRRNSKNQMVVR